MFSEKTELQEFTASTDRISSYMSLSGAGYHQKQRTSSSGKKQLSNVT